MNQHLISGNTCSVTCSHTSRLYPQRFLWLFLWLQIEITCDFHHVPMPKPHFERRLINLVQGTGNTHEDIHIFGTALWIKLLQCQQLIWVLVQVPVALLSATGLGKQWKMAKVFGPLTLMWQKEMKLLALDWPSTSCCSSLQGREGNPWLEDLYLHTSL